MTSGGSFAPSNLGDRLAKHAADRLVERIDLGGLQLAAEGLGVDPRGEQDLVGVGVADRGERPLVHEERADLIAPPGDRLPEGRARERRRHEIEAQLAVDGDLLFVLGARDVDLPHPLVVDVLKLGRVVEAERQPERARILLLGARRTPRAISL